MVIKRGDLFQLGRHRILCGDALNYSDVLKLLNGKKAQMLFTDPPYNIDYKPEERMKGGRKKTVLGGIMHDHDFDFKKFLKLLETDLITGSLYICGCERNYTEIYDWMKRKFKREPTVIVWDKGSFNISMRAYHRQFEFLFYEYFKGGTWIGGHNQTNLWTIKKRAAVEYLHPTQKPLLLIKKAIANSSKEGDLILDLFAGSGSTLIACEQTNRTCYTMEMDPKYCEVTIKRYEALTKKKAEQI